MPLVENQRVMDAMRHDTNAGLERLKLRLA